jgi:dCTP deaminase
VSINLDREQKGAFVSFWSGETLATRLPKLIDPFDRARIDCAAYTLRVGGEVYVSPTDSKEATSTTRRILEEREGFVIPPGQFAFLLTEERVEIPNTAVGFISMKARIKFRGLVNVSGFHVDPGYRGHLVFSVFNAGPSAVHLARGDDCFLIWYASLDVESQYVRDKPPLNGITSDVINPISGEVQSLANLAGRIDKVEREHQILRWMGATLLTLAVAVFIRGCSQ